MSITFRGNNKLSLDPDLRNYITDVLNGTEIVGEAIRLAVMRFDNWFTTDKYYFDSDKVNRVFDFIAHLKHFEDEWAGRPFVLLPWLKFVVANIFGWYKLDDHSKRVIRNVLMLISRKNGKTALSAAIALAAMVCDGIQGGECYLLANTREQAKNLYKFSRGFSKGLDPKEKHFVTFRDNLTYKKTSSTLKVLSSEVKGLDGFNPSCFIVDEFHQAQNYDLYNGMKSGQAARKNPLSIIISSAGTLLDGYPLFESVKVAYEVLRGYKQDDSSFYAIFLLDDDDDWKDENVWKKACPSYGITVYEDYMHERITEAENDLSKESDVKTKNLNIWCSSIQAWITNEMIMKSMEKVDLNDFVGLECYMGVDLSESRDLTAVSLMLPPDPERVKWPDKFIFKTALYVPPIAMKRSKNRSLYSIFVNKGEAYLTSGTTVNYDEVMKGIMGVGEKMEILKIGFDKWNAINFQKMAEEEGLPMESYSQSLQNFNIPTKAFTEYILNDMVIIDKNTAIAWCFLNVEICEDKNNNFKPTKAAGDQNKKIDGVIAMLEALGMYLSESNQYFGTGEEE